MRKLILAIAAGMALTAGSLVTQAGAMTAGSPTGLRHAIEDTDLTKAVHCRWGRPHHRRRWGWWDGCYRRQWYGPPAFYFGWQYWDGRPHYRYRHRHYWRDHRPYRRHRW